MKPELLPHWARVAFAARCARRVEPLFDRFWPSALTQQRAGVLKAIELAEQSSSQGRAGEGLKDAETGARMNAGEAITVLGRYSSEFKVGIPNFFVTVLAISQVTHAAACAVRSASEFPAISARSSFRAYSAAVDAASHAALLAPLIGFEQDFELLQEAAAREGWTDSTPVQVQVFRALKGEHGKLFDLSEYQFKIPEQQKREGSA